MRCECHTAHKRNRLSAALSWPANSRRRRRFITIRDAPIARRTIDARCAPLLWHRARGKLGQR